MTACIGALTVVGPSIVLAADTRVTHGSSPVEPNDQAGKQYPLPPYNFATAIAGSITECHEFVGRLVQRLELLSKADRDPFREEVMEAINDARFQVFRPKIDQAFRASLGITLQEWHDRFVPPAEFDFAAERFGMQAIRATPLNVACIVGGFTAENTMFFCAKGMEHLRSESSPGVHAIGSGSVLAMNQLNKRGQNLAYSLARTVFHVHEAMLEAQKEPTVGPPTNYLILTKGQPMTYVPAQSELLARWLAHYREENSSPLDTEEANFAIQREMQPVQMPPYDIDFPAPNSAIS
jgi:20S proteasome alpha/beta subunit